MKLSNTINIIPGIGPKIEKKLHKLGIKTIQDLIEHYPRSYIDLTNPRPISSFRIGNDAVIQATVVSYENKITYRRRMLLAYVVLRDKDGTEIKAVWFNQPFLKDILKPATTWLFAGKIVYDFSCKSKVLQSPLYTKKPEILAIYPETEGINSKFLRKNISALLRNINIDESLPEYIVKNEGFVSRFDAIKLIHNPKTQLDISKAKKRLSFEEFFILSYDILSKKKRYKSHSSYSVNIDKSQLTNFSTKLPFELTHSQQKALYEILSDITKPHPMTRLVNGDVGSGKTIVGAIACMMTASSGYKTVWMAPTEILATQHFQTLCGLFKKTNIKIGLLTANKKVVCSKDNVVCNNKTRNDKNSRKTKPILHSTYYKLQDVLSCDLIIGTHSLIQDNISIDNLALVIVDEEHRFGVKQRTKLITLNNDKKFVPHYLSMTATPIPRTLAISLYADFDISVIDQMPTGRKPIITRFVNPSDRDKAYDFIKKHINAKRQVFVICPLIQSSVINHQLSENSKIQNNLFALEKKSVLEEYKKLSKNVFKDFKVSYLHGKLKPDQKEKIMSDFVEGKIDVLVSTSVVEVGVNIPNASIMIVEDAERFGLAQLHQFRGRVGRGAHQSFCLLFSATIDPSAIKRLHAMEQKSSGFELSEIDLSTRGPGEFVGSRQSGFLTLKVARLSDTITLNHAKSYAKRELENSSK